MGAVAAVASTDSMSGTVMLHKHVSAMKPVMGNSEHVEIIYISDHSFTALHFSGLTD
jgi:hypothetical protein